MSSNPNIDAIQRLLQCTNDYSGGSDDDSSGDDSPCSVSSSPKPTKTCEGEGGCGGNFPHDQHGSDFEYAMLCSVCYVISTRAGAEKETLSVDDSGGNEGEIGSDVNDVDVSDKIIDVADATADADAESLMTEGIDGVKDDDEVDDDRGDCGREMGTVLANLRDVNLDRYDIVAGTNELAFRPYINNQDNICKKTRKFWEIIPDTTPLLYGYKHFHALLNTTTKRGWLGHCGLQSTRPGNDMHYVLWEIWETRCDRPRYDGIIIADGGECIKIQHLEKWLIDNALSSNVDKEYDHDWYER
jgi:hypothetical protein